MPALYSTVEFVKLSASAKIQIQTFDSDFVLPPSLWNWTLELQLMNWSALMIKVPFNWFRGRSRLKFCLAFLGCNFSFFWYGACLFMRII